MRACLFSHGGAALLVAALTFMLIALPGAAGAAPGPISSLHGYHPIATVPFSFGHIEGRLSTC